jgi:hypothetical protein
MLWGEEKRQRKRGRGSNRSLSIDIGTKLQGETEDKGMREEIRERRSERGG